MDKYEYKLRLEEIKALNKKGRFQESAQVADTIDWKKVRNIATLGIISDVYKINRRFEDAKEILLLADEKSPQNRRIVYSLCDLTIKMGQVVEAIEYYKEFVQLAPNDNSRYILLYKIYEAQDISLEERIAVLREYKKREYNEKWAYELAYLYHRIGLATECVEECDQLILWFGEGKYVTKAMELKQLYVPLSPAQQHAYDRQFGRSADREDAEKPESAAQETKTGTTPEEATPEETTPEEMDIQVKTMDMGQYNTINLQAALAESMREVLEPAAAGQEPKKGAQIEPVEPVEEPLGLTRDLGHVRDTYDSDDVEYQEDVTRVILDSAGWNVQATGQLEPEETEEEASSLQPEEKKAPAFEQTARPGQGGRQTDPRQERMSSLLSQEYDGQISLVLPEEPRIEKQITGQMNFQDVLAEWEARKKANEEKRKESIRKIIQDQTGSMFQEYDQSVNNGILQRLEKGEEIESEQPASPAPALQTAPQQTQEEPTPQQAQEEPAPQQAQEEPAPQQAQEEPTPQQAQEEPAPQQAQEEPTPQQAQEASRPRQVPPAAAEAITEQQLEEHVRSMSKEERERFASFVPTKGAMRQLLTALDQISLSAYTGNMIITGMPNSNMMRLAKNIVKELKSSDQNFSGKAARISGDVLSTKKADELISRIPGGALIVEQAGKLTDEGAQGLMKALNQEQTGVVVFLLDSKRAIAALLERCPQLKEFFTARFDIAALDSNTLVKYGCQYAYNQEYSIDELGRLALHTRIEDMQTRDHAVTVEEVRSIVDDAIAHAEKFSLKHVAEVVLQKRYDEDDMIVLRERDFLYRH